jgi:hypothetical protein
MIPIILHRHDDESEAKKYETNNIGLQSVIADNDDTISRLVSSASAQRTISAGLIGDLNKLSGIIATYTYVANEMFNLLMDVSVSKGKTQDFSTISNEAVRISNEFSE